MEEETHIETGHRSVEAHSMVTNHLLTDETVNKFIPAFHADSALSKAATV
jgi:hypothetical protein